MTAQQFGVAAVPLQRREAWRLALPLKEVGVAVVREALKRKAAMVVKCMLDCIEGGEPDRFFGCCSKA